MIYAHCVTNVVGPLLVLLLLSTAVCLPLLNNFFKPFSLTVGTAICKNKNLAWNIYVYICTCMHAFLHTHTHTHTHTRTHTNAHAHTDPHACTHTHAHTHAHTQHTHIYTHNNTQWHAYTHYVCIHTFMASTLSNTSTSSRCVWLTDCTSIWWRWRCILNKTNFLWSFTTKWTSDNES